MAKKKSAAKTNKVKTTVPVDAHTHVADKRPNIPTRETAAFAADSAGEPFVVHRDRSLDPQLVWKGKDEQDARPLEVAAVPLHVQEKVHPQAIVEAVKTWGARGKPKAKDEPNYTVTIAAKEGCVTWSTTGVATTVPAATSRDFTAQIPYVFVKQYLTEPPPEEQLLEFVIAPGVFAANGLVTRSSQVLVQSEDTTGATSAKMRPVKSDIVTDSAPIIDPSDAPLGSAFLAAYRNLRKYGFRRFADNQAFVKNQAKLEEILRKADKLLKPLEISRSDLESILDQRCGLSPDTVGDP